MTGEEQRKVTAAIVNAACSVMLDKLRAAGVPAAGVAGAVVVGRPEDDEAHSLAFALVPDGYPVGQRRGLHPRRRPDAHSTRGAAPR